MGWQRSSHITLHKSILNIQYPTPNIQLPTAGNSTFLNPQKKGHPTGMTFNYLYVLIFLSYSSVTCRRFFIAHELHELLQFLSFAWLANAARSPDQLCRIWTTPVTCHRSSVICHLCPTPKSWQFNIEYWIIYIFNFQSLFTSMYSILGWIHQVSYLS